MQRLCFGFVIPGVLAALALSPAASAQTTAGQINGKINDPSGAAILGASVTATNMATGVSRQTASNELGNYTVPLLEPGMYKVTVQKEGFRLTERAGITLNVNTTVRLDFTMTLGAVTESVSVTADVSLLQTAEASLGAVIDNAKIVNLPLNGRNPFDLILLAPGAVAHGRPSLPGNNIPLSNISINGSPAMLNEVLLDGIPNTSPQFNQYAIVPSIDAVQEFKVQTNSMAAEFGRTGGGVVNVSMRGGTNAIHGTVYEFLRNNAFDSNNWFNNANGQKLPPFRFNQFGASGGGPVRKDKTFVFGNWEALRRVTGRTILFSVPTPEQRQGDFTQTLAQNGQQIQVYDPMTSRLLPNGSYLRDQFPGNRIPSSRFNAVSRNILPFWGQPNLPGHPVTRINNFISNKSEKFDTNQVNVRIDHSFGDANRLFGRFSWNDSLVMPPNVFENDANPASGPQLFTQRNFAVNDTHTFSPTTFATFRAGFARLRDSAKPLGAGFDVTKLGFPAYINSATPFVAFPSISLGGFDVANIGFGSSSIGPVSSTVINNISNAYTTQADVTHSRGRHVLKAGVDARLFRLHGLRPPLPNYAFTAGFTQGPDPTRGSPTAGHSFASYLLGTASGGAVTLQATQDTQSYYFGGFVQDDFKLSSALTLNFGLRYERETLRNDRYDRLTFLDFESPSPLRPPGLTNLRGGLQFTGVNGNPREQARATALFSPRIGFAWQVRPEWVIRSGYGTFVAPRTGFDFGSFGQTGFSAATALIASIDGISPTTFYSDPYPNGFVRPTGASLGMLTNVGGGISSINRDQKAIYLHQWNFNIQRKLPGDVVIEAAYAGSKGTHLLQTLQYNQLPDPQLARGNELLLRVPNPFLGLIPASQQLGAATTTVGQLLRPYPHFTAFTAIGETSGSSSYHSFQLQIEKRLSKGLSFLTAYTNGKLIDDGRPGALAFLGPVPNFQNNNNRKIERSVSAQEISQRLTVAAQYDLPFGTGKTLAGSAPRWANEIIGGWTLNAIPTFQTGTPIDLTTSVNNTNSFGGGSRPNSTGKSAKLTGPVANRLNRYYDVTAFTLPDPYTFGNVARTLPDVRRPGVINFDFSMLKHFKLTERFVVQFRAEAFNALNNTAFGGPGTAIGGPAAGVISSASAARILQFGLKLNY